MQTFTTYSGWSENCRTLLHLHSNLDALCTCDHGSRVLGMAYTNPEFKGVTTLNPTQVREIRSLMGRKNMEKTSFDFLQDRYIVIEIDDNDFMAAKSGRKSLFVGLTKTLFLIGLTMDTDSEHRYSAAYTEMQDIRKYYEDADF